MTRPPDSLQKLWFDAGDRFYGRPYGYWGLKNVQLRASQSLESIGIQMADIIVLSELPWCAGRSCDRLIVVLHETAARASFSEGSA